MSSINVKLLIAWQQEMKVIELPAGATVAQLKAKFTELNSGIIKNLTGGSVVALEDSAALNDGAILSFSPTETRTTSTGTQVTTKKIAGAVATEAVEDGVTLTPVKIIRSEVYFDSTIPSLLTVGDVLAQAGLSAGCVFINWVEVGFSTQIGTAPVVIEIKDCESQSLFGQDQDEDLDDCDEDDSEDDE